MMKKTSSLFSILILLLFCLSCNKDDDAPSTIPITPDDSYFKAKIDGVEYIANGNKAVATINGNYLIISSLLPDGQNFHFESTTLDIGTYSCPYPAGSSYFMSMKYSDGSLLFGLNFCVPTIGELTITSLSEEEISGTFSFTARVSDCSAATTKNITDGSFKLKINQN